MARNRLPGPKRSVFITAAGAKALRDELDALWRNQRPKVTQAVSEAAAQGDRSENAEYIYGKKQLRGIDRRIRYLQKRLDEIVIVERPPDDLSRIFFGAWVTLKDSRGATVVYRIVGSDEIDLEKGWISIDSPLALAVLKKSVMDTVELRIDGMPHEYTIVDVHYDMRPAGI